MLSRCQGLRWSGKGISNGRQRLGVARGRRDLSSSTLRIIQSSSRPSRQPRNIQYITSLVQSRSLSLFGWSAPKPADAPSSSPAITTPSQNDGFAVKASHSTSDSPDPSSILSPVPMSDHEPELLSRLEDKISLPSEFDPTTLEHFSPDAERIGYLRDVCGLDFGWGTSTLMQSAFEYFHIYTACTWTTSIIAVTVLMRLSLVKFTIDSQTLASRMREIQPIIGPLREKYNAAAASGDRASAMKVAQEIRAVSRESKIGFFPLIKPLLFQIPLSFGGFRALRAAAVLPVPAFETESFLYHTNIALSDPIILPAVSAVLTFLSISKSMSANPNPSAAPQMQYIMKWGLPVASLIFMHWQAAAVQVFFLFQTLFSCVQTYALANESFRGMIGLPPTKPLGAGNDPLAGLNTRKSRILETTARPVQPGHVQRSKQENVSVIDKAVDAVKSRWSQATNIGEASKEKRLKKHHKQQKEQYEYRQKQDLDDRRMQRNDDAWAEMERKKFGDAREEVEEVGTTGMKVRRKGNEER